MPIGKTCLLLSGTVLMLQQSVAQGPAVFAQAPSADAPTQAATTVRDAKKAEELGERILSEFQEMLSQLNRITDRKTADQEAATLGSRLKRLTEMLQELERLPFTDEKDAQTIHADMSDLTHISQSCLAVMQKLNEVGAYGSEALMAVFSQYKIGENRAVALQADDMPHGQLCNKLADAMEDALYALSKVHDEASARDGTHTVEDMMNDIERTREMLSQLDPPRTEEQRDALQPLRERLQHVSEGIRKVNERLQKENYYNVPDLGTVIERLIRASVH